MEFTESTEGIYFENCVLTQFFGYKAGEEENNKLINFSLVSCSIASGDYVYREGWNNALLSLSQISPKNVSGLIEGCTIKVKSITIRNSLIECEKDNISLLCSAVFENNNIHLSKGYIYFTGIGIFKDNKVIYDQIVPNSGIIKIYNDAHIDILENEFNTPYEIEQNILFSHYGETANVSINLQKNKLPCETSSPISLPWATVLSRENESIIN